MAEEKYPREICEEVLVKKSTVFSSFWIAVPVVLVLIGSAVAWAVATSSDVSSLKTDMSNVKVRLDKLDEQVNQKLDIIIAKMAEQERIDKLNKIASRR